MTNRLSAHAKKTHSVRLQVPKMDATETETFLNDSGFKFEVFEIGRKMEFVIFLMYSGQSPTEKDINFFLDKHVRMAKTLRSRAVAAKVFMSEPLAKDVIKYRIFPNLGLEY